MSLIRTALWTLALSSAALPMTAAAQTKKPVLIVKVHMPDGHPWQHTDAELRDMVFSSSSENAADFFKEMSAGKFTFRNACDGVSACTNGIMHVDYNDDSQGEDPFQVHARRLAHEQGFPYSRFKGSDNTVSPDELSVLVISNANALNDNGATRSPCQKFGSLEMCAAACGVGNGASLTLIAHELAHGLVPGAIDLYGRSADLNTGTSLMGGDRVLDYMDPWHRAAYGYSTLVRHTQTSAHGKVLPIDTLLNGGQPILIRRSSTSEEAIILELREKKSYDAEVFDEGLFAWYVNATDLDAERPTPGNVRSWPSLHPDDGKTERALFSLAPVRCTADPMNVASRGRALALRDGLYSFRWKDGTAASFSVRLGTSSTGKPQVEFWPLSVSTSCRESASVNTVATGDFDGNGYDDLAIGAPYGSATGQVVVYYASDTGAGLVRTSREVWTPNLVHSDAAPQGNRFGQALAVADFDGDNIADLAVGAPGENDIGFSQAGAVYLLYGSASGLDGRSRYTQATGSIPGAAESGDEFGAALAVGQFDDDPQLDLAVGAPGEAIGNVYDAGAVFTLISRPGWGLLPSGELWHQDSPDVHGVAEAGDRFGASLAAADFDGNGKSDLAIGVPFEAIGDLEGAGMINVIYAHSGGGLGKSHQSFHAGSDLFGGSAQKNGQFGWALATTSEGNGFLFVGAPGTTVDNLPDVGAVYALEGQYSYGLGSTGYPDVWMNGAVTPVDIHNGDTTADFFNIVGGERFGGSLSVGEFRSTGSSFDLAIGSPGMRFRRSMTATGAIFDVNPRYGTGKVLRQESSLPGRGEPGDMFGASLAVGRFSSSFYPSLVVGDPGELSGTTFTPTTVMVVPSTGNGLASTGSFFD